LVLEVKGDLTSQIREMLKTAGRVEDYLEISLTGAYRYNPLQNDLDAFSLAYSIASLITALYGKSKDPFWQQAYSNLVKFVILLHKVVDEYVTLNQVYECAINPGKLATKIQQGETLFAELQQKTKPSSFVLLDTAAYSQRTDLDAAAKWEDWKGLLRAPHSKILEDTLNEEGLVYQIALEPAEVNAESVARRTEQFEACKRWYTDDWTKIDAKLRTSIVQGISVFLSSFDENPDLKRVFCPPKECYDLKLNADGRYGTPLPLFGPLIEAGRVVALNFSMSNNPGIARIIGTWMKQDYQRAMLNRIPRMSANLKQHFRDSLFLVDEFQSFAIVGEDNPSGDEKFFALSRQSKCIGIVAFQSISSLKSTLPGESWRTLLQQFRTKIFLSLSDDFSARTASDMCGSDEQMMPHYSISESGPDTRISTMTGRALAHKTGLSMNKSFSMSVRPVFQPKQFAELKNAQAICLAFNGVDPLPPRFLYLKFTHLDRTLNYFEQLERNML